MKRNVATNQINDTIEEIIALDVKRSIYIHKDKISSSIL
jgi:hypothetical protein